MQPPSVYDPPSTQPFVSSSDTSLAAAQKIEDAVPTQLHRVFYAILMTGMTGATDEELQDVLKMNPSSQRPRRIHLVNMGIVMASAHTRRTRSGRDATVWVATGKECPAKEHRITAR